MYSLPPNKQSRGLAVAFGGAPVGAIVTPLIVTPIALRYGWRAAFIVTGAAGFLWVLAWTATADSSAAASRRTQRIAIPNIFERRFWSLVSAYGLGALPLALILYFAQIYLARVLGFTQKELGLTLWIPPMGWGVGYFAWGWFNDRFVAGNRRPAWLVGLLAAMSLPLASVTAFRSSAVVLGLMFFAMFVASGFVVVALRTSTLAYPAAQTGLVAGIGAGSWSAIVGVVMPLFGRMFDAHHYASAFALASLVPVLGAGLWWLLTIRLES